MRILFQCNTVYQIMVAIKIKFDYFMDCESDIIISDISNGFDKIICNLKETHIFENVYLQKIKNNFISTKDMIFLTKNDLRKLNIKNSFSLNNYDRFIVANVSNNNIALFYLLRSVNKNIKFEMYEDGIATYSMHFGEFFGKQNSFKSLLNKKYLLKEIKKIYVFTCDFLQRRTNAEYAIISQEFSKEIISILNFIFDYEEEGFPSDCKYLYFEEGFYADKKDINDLEIIHKCFNYFGKQGFYVKLHPRNFDNRFSNSEIKTLSNFSTPWELFVLNNKEKIEKCTLITITSATIFTPNLLFGIKPKAFSCINMVNHKEQLFKYLPEIEEKMIKKMSNINYLTL